MSCFAFLKYLKRRQRKIKEDKRERINQQAQVHYVSENGRVEGLILESRQDRSPGWKKKIIWLKKRSSGCKKRSPGCKKKSPGWKKAHLVVKKDQLVVKKIT